MQRVLFLTWIAHQRTRNLARRLDWSLAELLSPRTGWRRYAQLLPRTFQVLRKTRPQHLVVQAPSQVLATFALLLRPLFGYRLILDAHNEAVEPYLHPSRAVKMLTDWLLRGADAVIVSNKQLAELVATRGGRAFILPDALPQPHRHEAKRLPDQYSVAVISTYADDEPLGAILEAARSLEASMRFYVTGNAAKCPESLRRTLPRNVTLTGFLSEHDYWSLLASCNAVLDLTTMDNCLVCGAYEAIALGKPVLLSGNRASMELFEGLAEFTTNAPDDIAAGLQRLSRGKATADLSVQRQAFEARWAAHAATLKQFIDRAPQSSAALRGG